VSAKRKRLKQGRDWHGWAWRAKGAEFRRDGEDGLFFFAYGTRPENQPSPDGRWVRVRFVAVSR